LEVGLLLCNLSPENPRYPLIVAKAHMEQGNLTESERFFKSSVKLSPTLSEGYKGLGSVYLRQKEYEKATKAFEKALDLEKRDIPTLNSLGMSYIKQGLFDEGIKRYLMALAIDNQDPRVLFNLGLAYEEKGTLSAAVDSFRRAIAADPSMEKAKRQLERILSESPNAASDLTQTAPTPKNPHQDFEDVSLDPLTLKKSS
ncbi:MAG: tetratricopeptide repeat protein, partial [Proteobacteria bacterium]|nr:tetratricopeptide repeat protein [Pseudomonadota bacterium]